MKRSGLLDFGHVDLMDNANQREVKEIAGPNYRKWPKAEIGNMRSRLWYCEHELGRQRVNHAKDGAMLRMDCRFWP
jgi:hypothetical protein